MKNSLSALLLLSSILGGSDIYAQQVIGAGSDIWSTPAGWQNSHSFADDPIPAGFFGPGSAPFNGTVMLEGLPFHENPGLNPQGADDLGNADTVTRRLEDMSLSGIGDSATTSIEIVALSLKSTEPIAVDFGGVETLYDVEFQLPLTGQQSLGEMTVRQDSDLGGTFDAVMSVNVNMFFVNLAGVFAGTLNRDIQLTANEQYWLFDASRYDLVRTTIPVQLGPGTGVTFPPTSPFFFPGFKYKPGTQSARCVVTNFTSSLTRYGRLPAFKTTPPDFDDDGIHDLCDSCPVTANPLQEDVDKNCRGDVCEQAMQIAYVPWGNSEKFFNVVDISNMYPDDSFLAMLGKLSTGEPANPLWVAASNCAPITGHLTVATAEDVRPAQGYFLIGDPTNPGTLFPVGAGGWAEVNNLGVGPFPALGFDVDKDGTLIVRNSVLRGDGSSPVAQNNGGNAQYIDTKFQIICTKGDERTYAQISGTTQFIGSAFVRANDCLNEAEDGPGGKTWSVNTFFGAEVNSTGEFDADGTILNEPSPFTPQSWDIPQQEEADFSQKVAGGGSLLSLCNDFGSGAFTSLGFNIASDGSCALNQPTDLPNTDPLVVIDANGIPQPQPGSPVIESGPVDFVNNVLPCRYKDLNGLGRPQDFDLDGVFTCDRGPVEIQGGPDIGASQTAAIFALNRNGEGAFVEMLAGGLALISFYTYSLDGTQLAWYMGLGKVVGNSIVVDKMQKVTGGVFGAGFDEASIVRTDVGGMSLIFPDCSATTNPGRLNFTARSDSGLENLLQSASRLTTVIACDGTKAANAQRSGAFFALGRSGEGIFVQWLSNGQVVLVFYTFDTNGNPFWVISDATNTVVNGNTVTANMLYAQGKTKFGVNFNSAEVALAPWGTVTLVYTDDDNIAFAYNSTLAGFGAGNHAYVRLTQPLGTKTVVQGD